MCLTDAWRSRFAAPEIAQALEATLLSFVTLNTLYEIIVKILHVFKRLILRPLGMHSEG